MVSKHKLTNTDKWYYDNWFKMLNQNSKCLWWFLYENCKATGFIQLCHKDLYTHFEMTSSETFSSLYYIRKKIEFPSEPSLANLSKENFLKTIVELTQDPSYNLNIWIKSYLKNQKNSPLSLNANVHISIINQLKSIADIFPENSKFWEIKLVEKHKNDINKRLLSFKDFYLKKIITKDYAMPIASAMVNSNSNSNINSSSINKTIESNTKQNQDTIIEEIEEIPSKNIIGNIVEDLTNSTHIQEKNSSIIENSLSNEFKLAFGIIKSLGLKDRTIENILKLFNNGSIDHKTIYKTTLSIKNTIEKDQSKKEYIDKFVFCAIRDGYNLPEAKTYEENSNDERLLRYQKAIGITKTKVQLYGYCSTKAYNMFPERYKVLFKKETHKNEEEKGYLYKHLVHDQVNSFSSFIRNAPDKTITEKEIPKNFE